MIMTVDDKLAKIGFRTVYEDIRHVHYERYEEASRCYHTVVIERRSDWNEFRLQSHDESLANRRHIIYTNAALSSAELKLFLKKMKKKQHEYEKCQKWLNR